MRGLSLEEANTIIAATFAAAKKRKCRPMSAIVLDAGGRVKAFQKQDGASMLRFEICYGKAYGALALGHARSIGGLSEHQLRVLTHQQGSVAGPDAGHVDARCTQVVPNSQRGYRLSACSVNNGVSMNNNSKGITLHGRQQQTRARPTS
jgi:hypothetical protein